MRHALTHNLCEAVWTGDVERVRELIRLGAEVNGCREDGHSPLHLAIEQLYDEIVELLLDAGADIERRDEDGGWTPLIHAVDIVSDASTQGERPPDNKLVSLLISRGADLAARTSKGRTALSVARRYSNDETARVLLAAGAQD